MFLVDERGRIEMANAVGERLFGYARNEMLGLPIDALVARYARADHAHWRGQFVAGPAQRPMGAGRDLFAQRKDGVEFPAEIGLTPVRRAGGLSVLAAVVDLSARRDAEKALQAKIVELERANASLAHFAFVASHDIQEPLRKIVAFSDILDVAARENHLADIDLASRVMRTSALHARELVADVLALTRALNSPFDIETISIGDIVEAGLANLTRLIADSGARIECVIEPLRASGDRRQAIQLFQNIVENAIKYRKPGSAPTVRLRAARRADGRGVLSICDDGIGFPRDRAEEIFAPFKRLHARDVYPGSGLGLAICKAIADRQGWVVRSDSVPGQGACFEIVFSLVAATDDV